MTISTPSLLPEPPPAALGAGPAESDPALGGDSLAGGFAQFLPPDESPVPEEPATPAAAPATNEQAAVLAASLLWAPLPLAATDTPTACLAPNAAAPLPSSPAVNNGPFEVAANPVPPVPGNPAPAIPVPTDRPAGSARPAFTAAPAPMRAGQAPWLDRLVPATMSEPADVPPLTFSVNPVAAAPLTPAPALPVATPASASPLRVVADSSVAEQPLPEFTAPGMVAEPAPESPAMPANPPMASGADVLASARTAPASTVAVPPTPAAPTPEILSPAVATANPVANAAAPATATPVATPESPAAPAEATVEAAAESVAGQGTETSPNAAVRADAPRSNPRAKGASEKFAYNFLRPDRSPVIPAVAGGKTFVSSTHQALRGEEVPVGTSVAQESVAMPSAPTLRSPAADSLGNLAVAAPVAAPENSAALIVPSPATAPAEQANDAVAAVLQVVDAQEQTAQAAKRTVNLDFHFGEERLAVRVELRDGTVHAHFRTHSPELREALAREWAQVSAAPENVLRLAEPVISAAPRGEQSAAFNADGGAHRQQSQAEPAVPAFPVRPAPAVARATTTVAAPEAPRLRHLPHAQHLQAVA